jgi:hypothetical protein
MTLILFEARVFAWEYRPAPLARRHLTANDYEH